MESKNNKENKKPKVKVTQNGPYFISGKIPLQELIIKVDSKQIPVEWKKGKKYPIQKFYSLCRCGQSKNKPFCDGTHIKIKFNGTETANKESYLKKPKIIEGPELRLIDYEELCASARFCHREGGIWDLVPHSDDLNKRKIAIEESCDCPSGRLVIFDKKKRTLIEPKLKKEIGLIDDPAMKVKGPIWVQGGIKVEPSQGEAYQVRNRVTLCRCGKSKNKPFCDSSHYPEAENVEAIHKR
jgi:CDGSH-type Zn-finger protein